MRELRTEGAGAPTLDKLNEKLPDPVALPNDALEPSEKGATKRVEFKPYAGRESLPEPRKDGKGKVIGPGEVRYFVAPFPGGADLIAVYKKHNGVGRKLVRVLKDKRGADKMFRQKLRRLGIPGA